MRGFNFVPIRSDPMLIFLSGNQPLHYTTCLSTRLVSPEETISVLQCKRCYTICNLYHNLSCNLKIAKNLANSAVWLEIFGQERIGMYSTKYLTLQDKLHEGLSHFAILQKCFATLPQSLRKAEADCTSCNACCNKNVARLDDCDYYFFSFTKLAQCPQPGTLEDR